MAASPSADGAAPVSLRAVNPVTEPDWDATLAQNPSSSFFHSAAWSAVLQDTYGYAAHYFTIRAPGALRALLPVMEVDSWLTGRRGVSLPFTDECGPVCADKETFKNLASSAIAWGRKRGWKYLEFRGGHELFDGAAVSLSFYGHELDLTGGEAEIFKRLDGSVRQGIKKAEKSGVTVANLDSLDGMKVFYSLFCQTRRKHGMPPQTFNFFRQIHRHVITGNLGRVFVASLAGQPIAAAIHFNFGQTAIYKFGASNEAFQHVRANNLVMWEAIKWHARNGMRSLNLGRTSLSNEGLRRFKLNWGAAESRIDYVKYDLRQDRFVADKDQASGWHNAFFKGAPPFLSRWIGAVLYRHWA